MLPRQQTARKKIREGSCRRNNAGGGIATETLWKKGMSLTQPQRAPLEQRQRSELEQW